MTTTTRASSERQKIIEMVLLSASFGIVFLIINFIHFQTIPVSVILYACFWDAIIAGVLVFGAYWMLRLRKGPLLKTEYSLVAISSLLLVMLYAVMGPTVIDRSLSIYIVEKIDQRGGEVSEASIPNIFTKEYMPEFRLVDVRMTEQLTSGTVKIEDGCVTLTPKGRRLSRFASWYRKTLLPKKRILMNEVTAQLTDPFAGTQAIVDTKCPPPF